MGGPNYSMTLRAARLMGLALLDEIAEDLKERADRQERLERKGQPRVAITSPVRGRPGFDRGRRK